MSAIWDINGEAGRKFMVIEMPGVGKLFHWRHQKIILWLQTLSSNISFLLQNLFTYKIMLSAKLCKVQN